jgi:hypothetical protein
MNNELSDFLGQIRKIEKDAVNAIIKREIELEDLPEMMINQEICINSIMVSAQNFYHIPHRFIDGVICLIAIQKDSNILASLPNDVGAWAAKNIAEPILSFVNEKYKSKFICENAIKIQHTNINFVPKEYLTKEYLSYLIQINPQIVSALKHEYLTQDILDVAISCEGFKLQFMPMELRDKAYCDSMFEKDYSEILYFPKQHVEYYQIIKAVQNCLKEEVRSIVDITPVENWTMDLIIEAMKKDDGIFSLIPYEMITTEMMFKIAKYITRYDVLFHAPESVYTDTLTQYMISQNPMLLGGIPMSMRNRVLCIDAVSKDGMALEFVPKLAQNEEIYHLAVKNNGLALKYVPYPYLDENLPKLAVEKNGEAIEFVPMQYVNELLCRTAVMNNPHAIYKIKKNHLNNDLIYIAIQSLPKVLKLIPVDQRTEELCYIALKQDHKMHEFIPTQLRKSSSILPLLSKYGLVDNAVDEVVH